MPFPFGDDDARASIRESLDESLLVEAAAGTGKTYELVNRAVNLLAQGRTQIHRLVIVTFSRKAAGELQLRLRMAIDGARAAASDPVRQSNLERALARLEEAHIGTIHGFCAEILRERPVEARVDPDFSELSDGQAALVHAEAFRAWLTEKLDALPLALDRALRRDAEWGSFDQSPIERLTAASRALIEWRDHPAPWRRPEFDLEAGLRGLLAQVRDLADMVRACPDPEDPLVQALRPVVELDDWWTTSSSAPSARIDLPAVEGQLLALNKALNRVKTHKASYGAFAPAIMRRQVEQARDELRKALRTFRNEAEADLAAGMKAELDEVTERYQQAKERRGQLDYLDLLLKVRDLVRNNAEVRAHLQARFAHILVDEFQDTDALQVEILMLLGADDPAVADWRQVRPASGKLFFVGDPKQSIYRFRRADLVLYQEVRRRLTEAGVRCVHLSRSFRANRAIQDAVNLAFAPEMTADDRAGQAGYVPLSGGASESHEQPSLIALPIPYLHRNSRTSKAAADESQPAVVAAWIDWLCRDSGWQVRATDHPHEWRPVVPQDICILFNRLKAGDLDRSSAYADALDARRLAHVLVGTWSFRDRPEIEGLLAVLTAIEWPEDELSVYAALRGPFLALSDAQLLRYTSEVGRLHPFSPVPDSLPGALAPVGAALTLLKTLCEGRNERPFSDTVNRLLDATRAHVGLALRPAGRRALGNVQRVVDLARTFEVQGGLSFRGFVEMLEVEAAQARGHEGPVDEPGTEGVRMMTVHTAKGSEFPVVILADVTASATRSPYRHTDPPTGLAALKLMGCSPRELFDNVGLERLRDQAEAVRLAYVAATRARDLLVVNTVGLSMSTFYSSEREQRSWVFPLEKVVYPSPLWAKAHPAPGVPKVAEVTCLSNPDQRSAQPGLHQPLPDGPPVVWWDPATLNLEAPLPFGLRQEHYLAEGPDGRGDEGRQQYSEWRQRLAEAIDAGNVASTLPLAATEATYDPPDFTGFVDEIILPISPNRPGGIRFGALVHAVLKDVALDADADAVTAVAKMHGRILEASLEETEAAADAVVNALAHSVFARARACETHHREWPILLTTDDGEALDGALDLAFFEDGQWVIVDFKTDHDPRVRGDQYRRQMSWYVHALVQTTGLPAYGILLRI